MQLSKSSQTEIWHRSRRVAWEQLRSYRGWELTSNTMNIDLLHRYFNDARRTYRACVVELRVSGSPADLMSMLRAARNREIDRKGQVATSSGEVYDSSLTPRIHMSFIRNKIRFS